VHCLLTVHGSNELCLPSSMYVDIYIYIYQYIKQITITTYLCATISLQITVWRTKKYPGRNYTSSRTLLNNKRTANVTLHLKSCFVVIKECQSPGIPAARRAVVITWLRLLPLNPGTFPYPWAGLLFLSPFCTYRRARMCKRCSTYHTTVFLHVTLCSRIYIILVGQIFSY
jgi:hypothetical protein